MRTNETRPGWVPPLPRDGGVHAADRGATAATCRFPAASPTPQLHIPSPGLSVTRSQRRFSVIHPSGHFPACGPRMARAPLDVNPDASNPTVTGDARQGREQAFGHWPGTTLSTSRRPPIGEFTRIVRHRVATPLRTRRARFRSTGLSSDLCRACAVDVRNRCGVRHFAYLSVLPSDHLCPFALWTALPSSPAGRGSCDYYGHCVAVELAPRRRSHVRLCHTCLA